MHHVDRTSGIINPNETLSPEARKSYQEGFLREVVELAYRSGTPLKSAMDERGLKPADIKGVADLQKLPIIHKRDLAEAQKTRPPFGGFLTVPMGDLVRIHQSPGPIYDPVGRVPDYWRFKAALYAIGFRPGDLVVNTFAYHLTPAGHMFEEGVLEVGATVIPTGVGNTETQIEIMKTLGATGYIGTPSFLMTIFKKAEEMGVNVTKDLKLEVGLVLAEMVPESLRRKFMDEYRLIARQAYGTADVGCVSYECPALTGMHIHYDVIVEICDPATGEVLPAGEVGEVVVTCNNKIYPLVRFGTGDISMIIEDECPCGRTGPRLTRILGRADEVTKIKGMFVHPSQVQKVLESHPEISRGRLVVDRKDDRDIMCLEVELKGEETVGLIEKVEQTLREVTKLKGSVKVVPSGALADAKKTIEDIRKWD